MSTLTFQPNRIVEPNELWDTTFLSDRDVSDRVPINFVPHPGIYATPACFGNGVYEEISAQTCLSNLLASQIRRYVFDVYWDALNSRFGLCPVELPISASTSTSAAQPTTGSTYTGDQPSFFPRQIASSSSLNATTSLPLNVTSTATFVVPTTTATDGTSVLQLGPYQCSPTFTLGSVISLFDSYMDRTSNLLEAKITVLLLNLRVASSATDPTAPPQELAQSQLPNSQQILSTYFDSLSDLIYTPSNLLSDRANLNDSWFHQPTAENRPLVNYFTVNRHSNGQISTPDGWPGENYIQITRGRRLLLGFGEIDPQISAYNTAADGASIFPPNYIASVENVTYDSEGAVQHGCLYNPNSTSVSQANSSWAFAAINKVDPPDLGNSADNLTVCGMTQMLNTSIDGALADVNPDPYQNFGNNAVFSWAYGQPENDSSVGANSDSKFRCALMVSDSAYRGHWRVDYCTESYPVACRIDHQPYEWSLSSIKVPFGSADAVCNGNATFDVPMTGLENTYLYHHIISEAGTDDNADVVDGVWINFNSLGVENCWIATGVNGSCPYYENADAIHSRQILIPAIAALIVLILTALTILVKCSTNARNSRVRRRGDGGWDYEGVPS